MSQEINDRGIALNLTVVENVLTFDKRSREEPTAAMQDITNLDNPSRVQQMKEWPSNQGVETESLVKKAVKELIKTTDEQLVQDALILRQQLAKSSMKKYQAMQNAACRDGRAYEMFQFNGANRSGR